MAGRYAQAVAKAKAVAEAKFSTDGLTAQARDVRAKAVAAPKTAAASKAKIDVAKAALVAKARGAAGGVQTALSDLQHGTGVCNAGRGLSADLLPVLTLESQCGIWCVGQVIDMSTSRVLVGQDALVPAGPATRVVKYRAGVTDQLCLWTMHRRLTALSGGGATPTFTSLFETTAKTSYVRVPSAELAGLANMSFDGATGDAAAIAHFAALLDYYAKEGHSLNGGAAATHVYDILGWLDSAENTTLPTGVEPGNVITMTKTSHQSAPAMLLGVAVVTKEAVAGANPVPTLTADYRVVKTTGGIVSEAAAAATVFAGAPKGHVIVSACGQKYPRGVVAASAAAFNAKHLAALSDYSASAGFAVGPLMAALVPATCGVLAPQTSEAKVAAMWGSSLLTTEDQNTEHEELATWADTAGVSFSGDLVQQMMDAAMDGSMASVVAFVDVLMHMSAITAGQSGRALL